MRYLSSFPVGLSPLVPDPIGPVLGLGRGMWGCMIHSYVIGRGNTATAYLQAGMIRPVPGATADAVVDVQVQRTGGESRLKDEGFLFCLAEKRAERACGEEKMATPGWTEKKRSSAPMRRGSVPQKIYWEGINLNKISKKIVSAVTMGAFALTLIPAAAFATPVEDSTVAVSNNALVLNADGEASTTVTANVEGNDAGKHLVFWFEDMATTATDAVTDGIASVASTDANFKQNVANWNGAYYWDTTTVDDYTATVTFDKPGTYYLYDATNPTDGVTSLSQLEGGKLVDVITVVNADDVVDVDNSRLLAVTDKETTEGPVSATEGKALTLEFDVDSDGYYALNAAPDTEVYIWVENGKNRIVDDATFSGATRVNGTDIWEVTGDVYDGHTLTATFNDNGDGYEIHAAVAADPTQITSYNEIRPITVNVAAKATTTDKIYIQDTSSTDQVTVSKAQADKDHETFWNYTINDKVTPNGLKDYTVEGYAWDANGNAAENEVLKISCQNAGLTLNGTQVTTDAKGHFEFTFSLTDTGVFNIVVAEAENDAYAYITVTQQAMAPVDIETVKDGGVMLAGTDDQYIYNKYTTMGEAVQFNIKDAYDRDATGEEVLALLPAADATATNHGDFIDVTVPEGSDLTEDDIQLAWDGSVYTIEYVGNSPVKDLVAGEYTVTVSLNNGKDATASFTLAEFGEAESLDISMTAVDQGTSGDANNDAITAVDDQIALGQKVTGKVYLVDAQGLKILAPASNLSVGVNGAAVASNSVTQNNPFSFNTVQNIPANQSVIGSIITVQAYDEVNRMYVEKTLNVVSNYGDETLSFDPTQGPVGENNGVDVTVVDANDKLSKVNGTMTAYIADQSNADAKITLRANEAVKDGAGKLYLESDKAGTVDVVVAVKADNGEIYANTLTYTFGDEDPYAGSYIVMTIGSDQYLINGEMFDGSADNLGAPYIDSAWRTMVPVRVLAESFGADVEYADNVVTIVDGDTTVVMNIGEETYTVNGEEQTMDTAAVIGDGDRTYVPVRFVAEALGYSVTPLYDANGLTSSVHFSK